MVPNANNTVYSNAFGGLWLVAFGITWDADLGVSWNDSVWDYGKGWFGDFGADDTVPGATRAAEGQVRLNFGPLFDGFYGIAGYGIRGGTHTDQLSVTYGTAAFTGPTNNYVILNHRLTQTGALADPDGSTARYVLLMKRSRLDGGQIGG